MHEDLQACEDQVHGNVFFTLIEHDHGQAHMHPVSVEDDLAAFAAV